MENVLPIYILIGIAAYFAWSVASRRRIIAMRDAGGDRWKFFIFANAFGVMLAWPVYAVLAWRDNSRN